MGNNHLHHIDSLVQYPGSSFQLNVLDVTPPVSVLSSYTRHNHFVFITYESVECFYNNCRVYAYSLQSPHNISSFCLSPLDLFISESTGLVTRLDSVTLEVKDQIKPAKMLPGRVSSMILYNDLLFLGHIGGDITGISIENHQIVQEFKSTHISPVETISISMRYNLLVISLGSTEGAKARILSIKRKFSVDLLGVKGKVNGLVVFDDKNLIIACDSLNQVVIWDLITGHTLVNALLPEFFPGCINTCICKTSLAPLGFALGFTNNAVAWGYLEYSEDACQYFFKWKGRSKSSTDGNVISLLYSSDVNGLLLTSDRAITLVLNDLNKDVKVVQNKKPLFSLSQHEQNIDYSTNIKIFRRNLTNKPPPVSQDMVNRIRERLDGKRGSADALEEKKKVENIKSTQGSIVSDKIEGDSGEQRLPVLKIEEKVKSIVEVEDFKQVLTGFKDEKNGFEYGFEKNEKDEEIGSDEVYSGGVMRFEKVMGGSEAIHEVIGLEEANINKKNQSVYPEQHEESLPLNNLKDWDNVEEISLNSIPDKDFLSSQVLEQAYQDKADLVENRSEEFQFKESKSSDSEVLNQIHLLELQSIYTEEPKLHEPESKQSEPELKPLEPESKPFELDSKPFELDSKPLEPESKPLEPESKSLEPESKPLEPESKPLEPESKPLEPVLKSFEPQSKPLEPESKPLEPESKPLVPQLKPLEPESKPLEPELKQLEPVSKPLEPVSKPLESLSKPLEPESNSSKPELPKQLHPEESKSPNPPPAVQTTPDPSKPAPKKPSTPFQIFLSHKKPEILKENPSATHKELVMKVTQLWGQLSESDKLKFSQPS